MVALLPFCLRGNISTLGHIACTSTLLSLRIWTTLCLSSHRIGIFSCRHSKTRSKPGVLASGVYFMTTVPNRCPSQWGYTGYSPVSSSFIWTRFKTLWYFLQWSVQCFCVTEWPHRLHSIFFSFLGFLKNVPPTFSSDKKLSALKFWSGSVYSCVVSYMLMPFLRLRIFIFFCD